MNPSRYRARRAFYGFRMAAPFAFAMWLAMANLYFATVITADPFRLALLGALGSLTSLRVALSAASLALLPVIPLYRRHRADEDEANAAAN